MTDTPNPIDVAAGARIRARRRMLNVSQEALADKLGLTFQQVQKYERGANRVSLSKAVAIAAALDTSVGALVGETADAIDAGDAQDLFSNEAAALVRILATIRSPALRRGVLGAARAIAAAQYAEPAPAAADDDAGPGRSYVDPDQAVPA